MKPGKADGAGADGHKADRRIKRFKDISTVSPKCHKTVYNFWLFFLLIDRALLLVVSKSPRFGEKRSLQSHHCRFEVSKLCLLLFFFLQLWHQRPEIKGLGIPGERASADCFVLHPSCFSKTHTFFHRNVSICIHARLQSFMTVVVTSSIKTRSTCSAMKCRQLKKRGNNNT